MWAAILSAAAAILPAILKLFTGSDKADQRELGRAEQQNADSKADMAVVKAANVAARAAQEPTDAPDPNDRDAAR